MLHWLFLPVVLLVMASFWLCVFLAPWFVLRATAFLFPIHWWFVAMLVLGICLLAKGWSDWHKWRNGSRRS
jgi:hypothetical protein